MTEPNASRPQWPTADAVNALAVLRDWLECNVVTFSPQAVDIMHEIVRPMSAAWTCTLLRSLLLK